MTRRLTVVLIAVVAGALAVALGGTALLLRVDARRQTERDLRQQASAIVQAESDLRARPAARRAFLRALRLSDLGVVAVGPGGAVAGQPPEGVSTEDLDAARLRAGEIVSGSHGSLVYAAAGAFRPRGGGQVVVLTRRAGNGPRGALAVAGLASVGALVVVGLVAVNLGRRLTRPLRAAQTATHRIAGGDLTARVPADGDDEVADLSRSINAMAAALERAQGLERQFLLTVSHDLRTPLTSIRGYAEAIADGRAPDTSDAAAIILAEARRLERLVGDLLELAKLQARRFSLDVRETEVAEVVADTAEGFRPAAEGAGLSLSIEVETVRPVPADPDRLAQVVANLTENALKFAAGTIRVGTSIAGDGAVSVWVEDDGPGIAPEDLPHVFERFYQSNRQPARAVGSGLGLAIVHELVSAMGGEVSAGPGEDGGCRVTVALTQDAKKGSP